MVKTTNAGIIGHDASTQFFRSSVSNKIESFYWKKIYVTDNSALHSYKHLPQAEIVNHVESIINDADIQLVFVSANSLEFVRPVIEAGKSVRII
jgi:hypothetical protein